MDDDWSFYFPSAGSACFCIIVSLCGDILLQVSVCVVGVCGSTMQFECVRLKRVFIVILRIQ